MIGIGVPDTRRAPPAQSSGPQPPVFTLQLSGGGVAWWAERDLARLPEGR